MNMAQVKLIDRAVAEQCIRNNTDLEDLHSGITPSSKKVIIQMYILLVPMER